MKIGLLGGCFNPPHKGHKDMALYLIQHAIVDKVIFVPTGEKYTYKQGMVSPKDRFEMVRLMIENNPCLEVSDYELQEEVVYTYQTLRYFKNKYKEDEIYFICGLDNIRYMKEWKNGEEILTHYKIIVFNRTSHSLKQVMEDYKKYQKNLIVIKKEPNSISSTAIRQKLQCGKRCEDLDPFVLEYIKEHQFYKEEK